MRRFRTAFCLTAVLGWVLLVLAMVLSFGCSTLPANTASKPTTASQIDAAKVDVTRLQTTLATIRADAAKVWDWINTPASNAPADVKTAASGIVALSGGAVSDAASVGKNLDGASKSAIKDAKVTEKVVAENTKLKAADPVKFWLNLTAFIAIGLGVGLLVGSFFASFLGGFRSVAVALIVSGIALWGVVRYMEVIWWTIAGVVVIGAVVWVITHWATVKADVSQLENEFASHIKPTDSAAILANPLVVPGLGIVFGNGKKP